MLCTILIFLRTNVTTSRRYPCWGSKCRCGMEIQCFYIYVAISRNWYM